VVLVAAHFLGITLVAQEHLGKVMRAVEGLTEHIHLNPQVAVAAAQAQLVQMEHLLLAAQAARGLHQVFRALA
jgi:hypothetical protein